jgi:hypothetical protein
MVRHLWTEQRTSEARRARTDPGVWCRVPNDATEAVPKHLEAPDSESVGKAASGTIAPR